MGWDQLRDIQEKSRLDQEREQGDPPASCPIDGEALDVHPKTGVRHCPMGNFTWRGEPRRA